MQPNNENTRASLENYVQEQAANYIDLGNNLANPNDSIRALAHALYSKSQNTLDRNLTGLLIENMHSVDIFSMLLEIVLYGTDMLPANSEYIGLSIMNPQLLQSIQSYIGSIGLKMIFENQTCDPLDAYLYRERFDLFCEIIPKPPAFLFNPDCWSIGSYYIMENPKCIYSNLTPLSTFKAFVISPDRSNVTIIYFQAD